MKKIVPDPPHNLDPQPGKVLSRAISEGMQIACGQADALVTAMERK